MYTKNLNIIFTTIVAVFVCMFISKVAASDLLSQEQPAFSSSDELESLTVDKAVDGNISTRWASAEGSDPEWIYVDLGVEASIDSVVLNWEVAYGKDYEIQVSSDSSSWETVYSITGGDGGMDELSVSGTGRYVRMYGTARGTVYGYSLWEFKIYGAIDGTTMYDLKTQAIGSGYVHPSSGTYSENVWAEIEAIPDSGWRFDRWEGDLSGNMNPTAIKMDSTKNVTAVFEQKIIPTQSPVGINGQLSVDGLKLVNQYGNPIQLRGMSTHGLQWFWNNYTDESLDVLAYEWGADILRISMYVQEGGWETNPDGFTAKVSTLINKATDRGMYALVDWHQLEPPDPNYNLTNAITFFTDIATAHHAQNNIIYDICNEPSDVSWTQIKTYADTLIPIIRAIDPDAVISMGTHGWSTLGVADGKSHQDILDNPVNFPNIMYGFHFYAGGHKKPYLDELDKASDVLPIFVTEWGTQWYDGDQENDFENSQKYINLMAEKKISWTNWNYSDDFRSGAVWKDPQTGANNGPWTDANLKPSGVWVKDKIMNPPDDFPTDVTSISADPTESTTAVPDKFELQQNYPNPFNPETKIDFNVKEQSHVELSIYDINGRLIKNLINRKYPAGSYEIKFNAKNLSSGIYFYSIKMGEYHSVKKMILVQ
ncbi:MAG: cellulase family glycosylhydrolase [Bacteroidales bacterium]|nr:cellulase family glycosylhydrolase [Bacteroidales bacterium]